MRTPIKFSVALLAVFTAAGFSTAQAASCDTPIAYVATSDGVAVVNTSSNSVVATIPLNIQSGAGSEAYSVVLNSDGTRLYARGANFNGVAVVDTTTNSQVATFSTDQLQYSDGSLFDMAFDPHANYLYVASGSGGTIHGQQVWLFNATTGNLIAQLLPYLGVGIQEVALNPAGTRLYVNGGFGLRVMDTVTFATIANLSGSNGLIGSGGQLLVNPTGTRLYVSGYDGFAGINTISVLDTGSNTVVATIPTAGQGGLAVSPSGDRLYDSHGSVIDTSSNTVVADIHATLGSALGNGIAITINATGTRLYIVTDDFGDENGNQHPRLITVDTSTNTVISTLSLPGSYAAGIAVAPCQPYSAELQPPINSDGTSTFAANRGVIPVKFTLTNNGVSTCTLPPATISVTRTAGTNTGSVNEAVYSMAADSGSNFRNDGCQYVYNLNSGGLGVGTYKVTINIGGQIVGSASFKLK
ncbi:MAG: hypothetical protein QOH01_1897 [Verrucomicrobiota bacterium]|jgi:DNA-binding beta-propeller fold protein YncE